MPNHQRNRPTYPPQHQHQHHPPGNYPPHDPHRPPPHTFPVTPAGPATNVSPHMEEEDDTPKRKLGKVDRGREACNECRRHKIRCHPHPDDPQHLFPCSRCERMSLTCEFAKHNRGRKRKRPLPLLAGDFQPNPSSHQNTNAAGSSTDPHHTTTGNGNQSQSRQHLQSHPVSLGDPRFPFISGEPEPTVGISDRSPPSSSLKTKSRIGKAGFGSPAGTDIEGVSGPRSGSGLGAGPKREDGEYRRKPHPHPQMSLRHMIGEDSSDDDNDGDDYSEQDDGYSGPPSGVQRSAASSNITSGLRNYHNTAAFDRDGTTGHRTEPIEAPSQAQGSGRKRARGPAIRGSALVDDPIQAGYVDETEARALFHLYMTHYNNALPMLDPVTHTHDHVRHESAFLYTAILCITSRYLSSLSTSNRGISPESAQSVHQQILVLARDHMTWAFAEALTGIDVVRAMVILAINKEPDDDKAWFHMSRAILLGKELNLGRIPPRAEAEQYTEDDHRRLRSRQRIWLCLFMVNSIFSMQFRQPMLILQSDPLVATANHWLKRSRPDTILRDTQLTCSVELRRKFLHYRDLLVGSGLEEPVYRSALSLSMLTRTMNRDWDVTSEAWIRDIIDVGGTSSQINKPRILTSSLRLNLNLLIVNQTLRLPPEEQIHYGPPDSIPAFHHCLNAATTVLVRIETLDKAQLTFAPDTFLHFALYAATLLSTLCRGEHPYKLDSIEIAHCRRLILKTAHALDAASAYPSDSPTLHAWYLRRLCQLLPSTQDDAAPKSASFSGASSAPPSGPDARASPVVSASVLAPARGVSAERTGAGRVFSRTGTGSVAGSVVGVPASTESSTLALPIDPSAPHPNPNAGLGPTANINLAPNHHAGLEHNHIQALDHSAAITTTMPVDPALTTVMGNELDFFLGDFPWVGLDATLDQIQHQGQSLSAQGPVVPGFGVGYGNLPGLGMWGDMGMMGLDVPHGQGHGHPRGHGHGHAHGHEMPVEMPDGAGAGVGVGVGGMGGMGSMGYGHVM